MLYSLVEKYDIKISVHKTIHCLYKGLSIWHQARMSAMDSNNLFKKKAHLVFYVTGATTLIKYNQYFWKCEVHYYARESCGKYFKILRQSRNQNDASVKWLLNLLSSPNWFVNLGVFTLDKDHDEPI